MRYNENIIVVTPKNRNTHGIKIGDKIYHPESTDGRLVHIILIGTVTYINEVNGWCNASIEKVIIRDKNNEEKQFILDNKYNESFFFEDIKKFHTAINEDAA